MVALSLCYKAADMQRAYLYLIAAPLLWSGNFVIGRATHASIGPLTLASGRWLVVLILLSPWVFKALRRKHLTALQWSKLCLLAFVGVSLYNTLIYIGLQYTAAPNGVIFNSTIPFYIIAINWVVFRQSLNLRELCGIVLSIIGVFILISKGELNTLLNLDFSKGDLWIITAALCWGLYTALLPRWRPKAFSALEFLSLLSLLGVIPIILVRIVNPFDEAAFQWTTQNIIAVIYTAIAASILAWFCFNEAVKLISSEIAGQSIHLMPVFVAIGAFIFLNETLFTYHLIGAAFIFLGLIIANKLVLFRTGNRTPPEAGPL